MTSIELHYNDIVDSRSTDDSINTSISGDSCQTQCIILSSQDISEKEFLQQWHNLSQHSIEANIFYSPALCLAAAQNIASFKQAHFFTLWKIKSHKNKITSLDHRQNTGQYFIEDKQLIGFFPIQSMSRYSRWPLPNHQNAQYTNCFMGTPLIRPQYESIFWKKYLHYCDKNIRNFNFLHFDNMSIDSPIYNSLEHICLEQKRSINIVQNSQRAIFMTDLEADAYYARNIRKKKRKEIQRLRNRLEELGDISKNAALSCEKPLEDVEKWLHDFLDLEAAGWKGQNKSALASHEDTKRFFLQAMDDAHNNGELHLSCLRLNGKPLAMLITLLNGKTGFSFKTAFDEEYARYSPGVLLQLENLNMLHKHDLKFIDSCAAENHPMIDRIWSERRDIGRVSIALSGVINKSYFHILRTLEKIMDRRNRKAQLTDRNIKEPIS